MITPLEETRSKLFKGKTKVILLSGKAGTGKSTTAEVIVDLLNGMNIPVVEKLPFAEEVKNICFLMGWNGEKDSKGRELLITVGNGGRAYDKNTWVRKVYKKILEKSSIVPINVVLIDDWRFPNEEEYLQNIEELEVYTIRLFAPNRETLKGTKSYSDISETSLKDIPSFYNYFIDNTGGISCLRESLSRIVTEIIYGERNGN